MCVIPGVVLMFDDGHCVFLYTVHLDRLIEWISCEYEHSCQPVVLIEANTPKHLARLQKRFAALNFVSLKPAAFVVHNYLFHPSGMKEKILIALQ